MLFWAFDDFGCTAFGFSNKFLHLFKGLTIDNRFVNIFEYCPVLLRIFKAGFVLKRFGISFEIDDIAAILLLRQYLLNGCLTPFVRIGLRFLTASRRSLLCQYAIGIKIFCSAIYGRLFRSLFRQGTF